MCRRQQQLQELCFHLNPGRCKESISLTQLTKYLKLSRVLDPLIYHPKLSEPHRFYKGHIKRAVICKLIVVRAGTSTWAL